MNIFKKFPKSFWIANTMELFERWAWYGFFMLFANYLTGSSDAGGLEFTSVQKGTIMGIGTGILYFLPVLTGAIADKYGYKKVLLMAFVIYASAFIFLPMFKTYHSVFILYIYLAIGAALFKPVISATVAKTTNESNSSIGFGIFYMMVNLGAFIGPMVTLFYKNSSYQWVFMISAMIICINFILLLFYKEPDRKIVEESFSESLGRVFKNIGAVLLDFKFLIFLLIVAGFWTMYFQLFFTLPVFITQWVDTTSVYDFFAKYLPFFSTHYGNENGQMEAEFITNFDAMFIIIFQIIISTAIMKWRPLKTMTIGFLICTIGMVLTLVTQNVMFVIAAILIFSIGEMIGSPKITEYIGRIAPKDKKALYMGYSFLPVFLGSMLAGIIAGGVYQRLSDKPTFMRKEAAEQGISLPENLSLNEQFSQLASKLNMNTQELTSYLWDKHHPFNFWIIVFAVGLLSVICLFFYDRMLMKKK